MCECECEKDRKTERQKDRKTERKKRLCKTQSNRKKLKNETGNTDINKTGKKDNSFKLQIKNILNTGRKVSKIKILIKDRERKLERMKERKRKM